MNFKKIYLPAGLVVAIALALGAPLFGVWLKENGFIPFFVVAIFFVSGWRLNLREGRLNRKFVHALLMALTISLLGGPFLGMAAVRLFALNEMAAVGMIVMSCAPVTLSSATVITEVARGNAVWTLFITIVMNAAGIFTMPIMLPMALKGAEAISIEPERLLLKLLLLLLLPFAMGVVLRKIRKAKPREFTAYIPSTCVILTVYAAFSASRDIMASNSGASVLNLLAAAAFIHFSLMLTAIAAGKCASLATPDLKSLMFVASQKTLPIAISVLAILCDKPGAAIIACVLFHLLQLLADSMIAAKLAALGTER